MTSEELRRKLSAIWWSGGRRTRMPILLDLGQRLGYGETKDLMAALEEVSRLLNAYSKAILTPDS